MVIMTATRTNIVIMTPNDYLFDDPYGDGGEGPVGGAPLKKANDMGGPVDDPVDKSRWSKRLFCS